MKEKMAYKLHTLVARVSVGDTVYPNKLLVRIQLISCVQRRCVKHVYTNQIHGDPRSLFMSPTSQFLNKSILNLHPLFNHDGILSNKLMIVGSRSKLTPKSCLLRFVHAGNWYKTALLMAHQAMSCP